MDTFEYIRDALIKHLPRATADGPIRFSTDLVEVIDPGISLRDCSALLAELTGQQDFLPDDLRLANLKLASLSLKHSIFETAFEFRITGKDVVIRLADEFQLTFTDIIFSTSLGRLTAQADVKLDLDGFELSLTLELPSQYITGRLGEKELPDAGGFLTRRGLVSGGDGFQLRDLSVAASIPLRAFQIHVELENLFTLGPVVLAEAQTTLSLVGGGANTSADALAILRIDIDNHEPVIFSVEGVFDNHGWSLAGSVSLDPTVFQIGHFVASAAKKHNQSPPDLPQLLTELGISHLAASVDTHDDSFSLDCTLAWEHDAELLVHLERQKGQLLVSGTLHLGEVQFRVVFAKGASTVLLGSYDSAGQLSVTLDAMLAAVSSSASEAFGPNATGIDLGIRSIALALDDKARMLLAAEVDAGIDLSRLGKLPLLGNLIPRGKPLGLAISPLYLSENFSATETARSLLPDSLQPSGTIQEGMQLSAVLNLGGEPVHLPEIDLGTTPDKARQPQLPAGGAPDAAASSPIGTPLTWKEANLSLGPLHIGRVGYAFNKKSKQLDLAVDSSLSIAGLTISVEGLGARYDFDTQALAPRLQGLGIDLKRDPLEIGGAFLNVDGDFAGKIVIGTPQFSLNALGAFAMLDGNPSMFVYGVLDMPLGGPVFFFVEGLAAGFGVHRKLKMPAIDAIHQFPLVSSAVQSSLGKPVDTDPGNQLRKLHRYVIPRYGEYFFAAGVKFNSFRLLDGFIVLVVSLGDDFEVDVIGTASFATPPDLPATVPALARIELDLVARFVASDGRIAAEALLNPKSYVYGPQCHLSGGFAFYAWLKDGPGDITAGDFVLSVGGFHPDFTVPAHYPRVSRIELKYQVTPNIYLKGDAYFAMTPALMMAGGGLHANIQIDSLHAWADFTADFLVRWEPFHYDARIHIGIGARWKCFHTSASADLHIWGPDFSGKASVDWFVFSFDVEFGPETRHVPAPITTEKFNKSFLQIEPARQSQDDILGIVATGGVNEQINGQSVVTAAELVIAISSRVPVQGVSLGNDPVSVNKASIGVAPANISELGESELSISIREIDGGLVSSHFKAEPVYSAFPPALWGRTMLTDPNARLIQCVSGIQLMPAAPPHVGTTVGKQVKNLQNPSPVSQLDVEFFPQTFTDSDLIASTLPIADLSILGLDPSELTWVKPIAGIQEILDSHEGVL